MVARTPLSSKLLLAGHCGVKRPTVEWRPLVAFKETIRKTIILWVIIKMFFKNTNRVIEDPIVKRTT